jgi:hypothetical protein
MALDLLPPQWSLGADDEIENASCHAKPFLDTVFQNVDGHPLVTGNSTGG